MDLEAFQGILEKNSIFEANNFMDNATVHIDLHRKNQQKRDEFSSNAELQLIPAYYGETLFDKISPSSDPVLSKATSCLLSNTPTEDLPPLLQDLLKSPPEQVLSSLIEYYTRLNTIKNFNK